MPKSRDDRIRDIRSRIPYLTERHLALVDSFIKGLSRENSGRYSIAEYRRPVLEQAQQKQADCATLCMEIIADSLIPAEYDTPAYIDGYGSKPSGDPLLIGWSQGDLIAVDILRMMELWNKAGIKRTSRKCIIEGMEHCGFILPRRLKKKNDCCKR